MRPPISTRNPDAASTRQGWHSLLDVLHRVEAPRIEAAVFGAVAAAGLAYVGIVNQQHGPTICPLNRATGLYCPLCGSSRGLHDLLHGHVASGLGENLLLAVIVPVALWAWLVWLVPTIAGRRLPRPTDVPPLVWWGLAALALVFGVLRNIPAFHALAPT
jgi:hypothetical protein